MTSPCHCRKTSTSTLPATSPGAPVDPDRSVGALVRERPETRAIFEHFGIDQCCGAGLSVRQAAAAAGTRLDAVLAALDAPASEAPAGIVRLDVRGLEPPAPLLRVLERAERLAPGQTLEVLHNRRPLLLYPQLDTRGLVHATDEPEPGVVRIVVRRPA